MTERYLSDLAPTGGRAARTFETRGPLRAGAGLDEHEGRPGRGIVTIEAHATEDAPSAASRP